MELKEHFTDEEVSYFCDDILCFVELHQEDAEYNEKIVNALESGKKTITGYFGLAKDIHGTLDENKDLLKRSKALLSVYTKLKNLMSKKLMTYYVFFQ